MRVCVLGVGGPAGANTCRALVKAGHRVVGYEPNPLHQSFAWDWCHDVFTDLSVTAINATGADVVIPQPDTLVRWLASHRDQVEPRVFLPDVGTIDMCQHKTDALETWFAMGVRQHAPIEVGPEFPDWLHLAQDAFGVPFWIRATQGAGGKGSALIRNVAQGYHWLRFWQEHDDKTRFVAEEYLPGRDFAWLGVYWDGELVSSFARERLEYLYPHLAVSGRTGTPTVATVVHDSRVNEMAEVAVSAITPKPHGVFCVDLREDKDGTPRPTEINTGRFCTTIGAWHLAGVNYPDLVARLAVDGRRWWLSRPDMTEPAMRDAIPAGTTLARHVDLPARVDVDRRSIRCA